MKINTDAVYSLIRSAVGANNTERRELIHALEYYNSAHSHHSVTRLMVAAADLLAQNNSEKTRAAFCSIIDVAA